MKWHNFSPHAVASVSLYCKSLTNISIDLGAGANSAGLAIFGG